MVIKHVLEDRQRDGECWSDCKTILRNRPVREHILAKRWLSAKLVNIYHNWVQTLLLRQHINPYCLIEVLCTNEHWTGLLRQWAFTKCKCQFFHCDHGFVQTRDFLSRQKKYTVVEQTVPYEIHLNYWGLESVILSKLPLPSTSSKTI